MSKEQTNSNIDILVVDDSAPDLKLLSAILTAAGFEVRPAKSADLALRSIQAKVPELILLDIRMPGMNGFELCRLLKANDKTNTTPIIFCSALDNGSDISVGFQVGAVDYISKPFQPEEVIARVNTHLKLKYIQIELEEKVKERTCDLTVEIEERKKAEAELKDALAKVKTLSGLLPICTHCKKIRDDNGYWNKIETYIAKHTDAEFSHSICQECAKKHYPDYDVYYE